MITLKNGKKIELNQAFNMDCLDFMKELPDKCIDNVLTSPPYNMMLRIRDGKHVKISKNEIGISSKYGNSYSDDLSMDQYFIFIREVACELLRICKHEIFFNIQMLTGNKSALFRFIGEFHNKIKEVIIWDKKNGEPAIGENILNSCYEYLIVLHDDNSITRKFDVFNSDRGTENNIIRIKKNVKSTFHKAAFPLEIADKIIRTFTKNDSVVFDPFLGSFTTAIASDILNRNWLGCEKAPDYFKSGYHRYEQETKQTLFDFGAI